MSKGECVGHVQKRMGSRLRNYKNCHGKKLPDGKSVGSKGRLTDKMIDKMQNFYGQSIRNTIGDLEDMKNSIWAIFGPMICDKHSSLEDQQALCPRDADTWCKYWKSADTYNEANRLPHVFRTELKPIFQDLTKETLLTR